MGRVWAATRYRFQMVLLLQGETGVISAIKGCPHRCASPQEQTTKEKGQWSKWFRCCGCGCSWGWVVVVVVVVGVVLWW